MKQVYRIDLNQTHNFKCGFRANKYTCMMRHVHICISGLKFCLTSSSCLHFFHGASCKNIVYSMSSLKRGTEHGTEGTKSFRPQDISPQVVSP